MLEKIVSYEDWRLEVLFLSKKIEAYINIDEKFISHSNVHSIIHNEEECITLISSNLNKSQEELKRMLYKTLLDMEKKEPHIFEDHVKLLKHYYKNDTPQELVVNFYRLKLSEFKNDRHSLIESIKSFIILFAVIFIFFLILERFGFILN